jgi:HK97 family phage prohead protease
MSQRKVIGCKFDTSAEWTITGYASVFNVLDSYGDVVKPGAFAADLRARGNARPFLADHDPSRSIGVATFYEDARGLRVTAKLEPGLQDARDTWLRAKAGILNGLSIGYTTTREKAVGNERHLLEIELFETSAVVFPANASALIDQVKGQSDLKHALRRATNTLRELRSAANVQSVRSALSEATDAYREHLTQLRNFNDAIRRIR